MELRILFGTWRLDFTRNVVRTICLETFLLPQEFCFHERPVRHALPSQPRGGAAAEAFPVADLAALLREAEAHAQRVIQGVRGYILIILFLVIWISGAG